MNKLTIPHFSLLLQLATLAALLLSCDEPVYYNIPPDDFPFFHDGDSLVFKSRTGDIDSVVIKLGEFYNVHDKQYYYQRVHVNYLLLLSSGEKESFLSVQQGPTGAGVSERGNYPNVESIDQTKKLSNGVEVNKVSIWKRYDLKEANDSNVVEIWYQPHYGIFKYKMLNGVWFELQLD